MDKERTEFEEVDSKIESDIDKFNESKNDEADNQEAMASAKDTVDPVENQEEVKADNQAEDTSNNQATSVEDDSKGLGFEAVEAEGNNILDQMDNGGQELLDQVFDKAAEALDNKIESMFEGDKNDFDAEAAKDQVIKDNSVEVEGDHGVVKDEKDVANAITNEASQSSSDNLQESTEALDVAADKLDNAFEKSDEKEMSKDDLMKEVSENAKDTGQENEEVKSANSSDLKEQEMSQ